MGSIEVGETIPGFELTPNEVGLFLFSAAGWATHRIHYDKDYAKSLGHSDLPVHGPLQGALLLEMVSAWARSRRGVVQEMRYTNRNAAYVNQPIMGSGRITAVSSTADGRSATCELLIEDAKGAQCTAATAVVSFPPGS